MTSWTVLYCTQVDELVNKCGVCCGEKIQREIYFVHLFYLRPYNYMVTTLVNLQRVVKNLSKFKDFSMETWKKETTYM
jgi:hypothetical protein